MQYYKVCTQIIVHLSNKENSVDDGEEAGTYYRGPAVRNGDVHPIK